MVILSPRIRAEYRHQWESRRNHLMLYCGQLFCDSRKVLLTIVTNILGTLLGIHQIDYWNILKLVNTLPRLVNTLPRLVNTLPRLVSSLPRLVSSLPRLVSSLQRLVNSILEYINIILGFSC